MTLRKNYHKTCLYCGAAFESNRNTAQYCSSQHGSMYRLHGRSLEMWREHGVILENNNRDIFENNNIASVNDAEALLQQATLRKVHKLLLLKEQYKEALQNAYNNYVNPANGFWSISIAAAILQNKYQYAGPFPKHRGDIIVQGDFLIESSNEYLYKIKPIELCSDEELKAINWQWKQ